MQKLTGRKLSGTESELRVFESQSQALNGVSPYSSFNIARATLFRGLRRCMLEGDTSYLSQLLGDHESELLGTGNDSITLAFGGACLYLGDNKRALRAYSRIESFLGREEKALMGLLLCLNADYFRAKPLFEYAPNHPDINFAKCFIAEKERGITDPQVHLDILREPAKSNPHVNYFLGATFFNDGRYAHAEAYFNRALTLLDRDQHSWELEFDLLRAKYMKGDKCEAYNGMSAFYHKYPLGFTPNQTIRLLTTPGMSVPDFKIDRNLYDVLCDIRPASNPASYPFPNLDELFGALGRK